MTPYPKIQSVYKRDPDNNFKTFLDEYSTPEIEYLADNLWLFKEKIDGCVSPRTGIRMSDGTTREITKIRPGDCVLGFDESTEQPVPSLVKGVTNRPSAGSWVKVRATRTGLGSGNCFSQVICTHDHKIWSPGRGWVEAVRLIPGDFVLSSRTDLSLTPLQKQVITGKLLGDGSLSLSHGQKTANLDFGHINESLVNWTLKGLGDLAGKKRIRTSGYGSRIIAARSIRSSAIYSDFKNWIAESKIVPENIDLTPISLAFWYMDDGSLLHNKRQEDRARFATNGFDMESCERLKRALGLLDIKCDIRDYKGPTLTLDAYNAEKLFLLIAPYIPEPMQYKLPKRYRGHTGWMPDGGDNQYKQSLRWQAVTSVTSAPACERWDIETETGNFFTTGMLVHNTNIRVIWNGFDSGADTPTWIIKGRTDKAQVQPALTEAIEVMFNSPVVLRYINENFLDAPLCFYGEGYGGNIQKAGPGYRKDPSFICFDVKVGEIWLKAKDVQDLCGAINVPFVPTLGYGPLSSAETMCREGFQSLVPGSDVMAEGVIAIPEAELLDRNGRRIITKLKRKDFAQCK